MAEFSLATALKIKDDFTDTIVSQFRRLEKVGSAMADSIGDRLREGMREGAEEARKLKEAAKAAAKAQKEAAEARRKILDAGKAGVGRFSDRLDAAGGVAMRAGAGVAAGAAAGLAGAAALLNSTANDLARINRMAEAQDLDPTLLSALEAKAAAEGIENLDEVGRATEEFFLRLTELQQKDPTGELFSNLKDVGADDLIKQFKNVKDPTEALVLALSTLATEKDEAKRIRLADSIFGGSDAALDLRRIAKTKDDVRDLVRNQQELSGATREQFAAATRLSEAKAKLGAQIKSVRRALAGALAPAIEEAVSSLSDWAMANREIIRSKIDSFVERATETIRRLMALPWSQYLRQAADAAREAGAAAMEFGRFLVDVASEAVSWGRQVIGVGRELGVTSGTLVAAAKVFFTAWAVNKVARLGKGVYDLGKTFVDVAKAMKTAASTADKAGKRLSGALRLTGVIGALVSAVGLFKELLDYLEQMDQIAKTSVEADISGQGQERLNRAQSLQAQNRVLRELAVNPVTAPQVLGGEQGEQARQFVERAGGFEAAQRQASDELRRNQATIDQLVQEATAIEQVAKLEQSVPTSVQQARQQAAAGQVAPVGPQLPEAQKLLDTLGTVERAALLQAKATEQQIEFIRDQRFAAPLGAR